jgi:hypothetical protein
VLRFIRDWLGVKTGVAVGAKDLSPVRPAGAPSFEPLEPRVLLDADLPDIQPLLTCGVPSPEQAVYVDLDRQDDSTQTALSSAFSIDVTPPTGAEGQQAVELFGISPALFVENQGQWSDSSIRYVHDGNGIDVAMTDTAVVFRATDTDLQMLQFSASFVGANAVRPVGLQRSASLFNYYVGDQTNWRQNVPSYEVVAYEGLYDGIDLRTQGLRSHLKYEFHVAPGADYSRIAVRYEGIEGLSLSEDGSLQVNLGAGRGVIRDDAPYIYQEIDSQRVEVAGRFILLDNQTYSFAITGPVDPDHALVIDPDLAWSTYLGGSAHDIAVDTMDNVYVTGSTNSSGWTSGGFDTTYNGGDSDAFVIKLSSSGAHVWSTYLGGSNDDWGYGIGVDGSGNVYATGHTTSAGWTSGGFDTTYSGDDYFPDASVPKGDAFVVKLNSAGNHLWSTYLGGSEGADAGTGVGVDAVGNIYAVGITQSSGWTSGGFDTTYNGGEYDIFVAKLSSSGAHLWSTYLGGSDHDSGGGIAVDASGGVYVTGSTQSSDWASGGFDTTYGGSIDAFVAKLSSSGAQLWSTYLGGSDYDAGNGIAVGASGTVYVTGSTESSGWTSGGFDTTYNGGASDAFVIKLSSSGVHLWSTYLGGSNYPDDGSGIAVDTSANVYVTGSTQSSDWASGGFDTTYGGSIDAFVAKLSSSGTYFWSTYLGGSAYDYGDSIAVDALGNVCVAGPTDSSGWISGGFDTNYDSGDAGFVAKITGDPDIAPPSPNPSTWSAEPYATGPTSIRMVATMATDVSGVEYYFDETSGNPGATDSGWQDSTTYEDMGLSPGTTYTYQVRTRDRSVNHNEGTDTASVSATTPSPVHRFWKSADNTHFFTIKESEKQKLIDNYSHIYTYEGPAYYAFMAGQQPAGTLPVYRFWKPSDGTHFYTIKESEKQKLIDNYSHIVTYEGPAYYAYGIAQHPLGTLPVYRFWKPSGNTHFFTIRESEKDKLIALFSHIVTFEGIAWYAYAV